VNLTILATTPDGNSCSNESRYRRFQDFFLHFSLCFYSVSRCILARIPRPQDGFILAMDRTNWKFGRKDINFLAIGVVVGKISIPIVWKVLPPATKRGNSKAAQRIALTKKLLKLIPASEIRALTMDREFHGKEWLIWLEKQDVAFVLRIKKSIIVGEKSAAEHASARGQKPQSRQKIFGMNLFFGCKMIKKDGKDRHLLVVSNGFAAKEAMQLYKQRWGIERLFGHLKKKGFDLEATHITDGAKLEKLFAIVALAFTYSYGWGYHLRQTKIKSNAASNRKSLFRLGLEDILTMMQPLSGNRPKPIRWKDFSHWLANAQFNSIFLV